MTPNPFLGVLFHWLGGLAAASFYVPYRGVKQWSWETYWLVGGFFSWIVVPWILGLTMTSDLLGVLRETSGWTLFWTWFFGLLWGLGGLTFGLSVRYLGMSLGYGVALGTCAVFGTLIPPLFFGTIGTIAASPAGRMTLVGVAVCVAGIALAALAGLHKERELSDEEKKVAIKEFALRKGIAVAVFCGVMSACFAFALTAGEHIGALSAAAGTTTLWTGLPKLVVILLGGFTSNAIWCLILARRNRTGREFIARELNGRRIPRLANLFFCVVAGATWYLQFFFYTMGETQMGDFKFSSWTLHMASIIIFSTLWGVALREWKGSSPKTHRLIAGGIAVLILSTLVVGYGTYLGALPTTP